MDAPGAEVIVAVHGFHADIAEQAGQQRLVQLLEGGRGIVGAQVEIAGDLRQLAVQLAPFAHAQV